MAENPDIVVSSRRLSRTLLRKPRHERWQHTKAVAHQAVKVAVTVPESDQKILVAAAWLHDIGYTRKLKKTGFHPLDGAIYLRDNGWDARIVALVAHHSGARFVPVERGFAAMMAEFPFEDSPVSDALTFSDQTMGPCGQPMTVAYRINEAITRHGPDSPNAPSPESTGSRTCSPSQTGLSTASPNPVKTDPLGHEAERAFRGSSPPFLCRLRSIQVVSFSTPVGRNTVLTTSNAALRATNTDLENNIAALRTGRS